MKQLHEDFRCACGKLLFRGLILTGEVEVKCRFCKETRVIHGLTGALADSHRYVLFVDREGLIVRTGETAGAHSGYTPEDLARMYVQDLLVMVSPAFFPTLWETIMGEGTTVVLFQTLQRNKDKSMVPVSVEAQPFKNRVGAYIVFIVKMKEREHPFDVGGTLKE